MNMIFIKRSVQSHTLLRGIVIYLPPVECSSRSCFVMASQMDFSNFPLSPLPARLPSQIAKP